MLGPVPRVGSSGEDRQKMIEGPIVGKTKSSIIPFNVCVLVFDVDRGPFEPLSRTWYRNWSLDSEKRARFACNL